MPQPARRKVADQVSVQLVEADVDIGFALVDEAKRYLALGQLASSVRVLQEASAIVADIERRLGRLGEYESGPFRPLVTELRNELAAVERQSS
jgi:hypothetical protein